VCISREKVNIPAFKSYITIEGDGAEETIVKWSDTAQTPGSNGRPLGTYGSATFAVNSPYFIAKNITFQVRNTLSLYFYPNLLCAFVFYKHNNIYCECRTQLLFLLQEQLESKQWH